MTSLKVCSGFGFGEAPHELRSGCFHFDGVVDRHGSLVPGSWHNNVAGFGSSNSSQVSGFGGSNFVRILNGEWESNWSFRQVVGQDAESAGVGGVADADFLAFWVDVSPAADLVAESVAVVDGSLSGVSITEAGLTEFILRVVLVGGQSGRVASVVRVTGSIGCWQSWSSDCWSGPVVVVVVVVRPLGLSSYGQKQDCYLAPNT